jgi:hypothetical protein
MRCLSHLRDYILSVANLEIVLMFYCRLEGARAASQRANSSARADPSVAIPALSGPIE